MARPPQTRPMHGRAPAWQLLLRSFASSVQSASRAAAGPRGKAICTAAHRAHTNPRITSVRLLGILGALVDVLLHP